MLRICMTAFVVTLGLLACSEEDPPARCADHAHADEGTPTGAMCGGSTLTYENFGMQFMETYCTGCHSSDLEGDARNCAPDDHNFDTLDGILFARTHIDELAGAGPSSVNEHMPPSGIMPTEAQRRDLSTWLACEEERMP
jgi:hypothetical protein